MLLPPYLCCLSPIPWVILFGLTVGGCGLERPPAQGQPKDRAFLKDLLAVKDAVSIAKGFNAAAHARRVGETSQALADLVFTLVMDMEINQAISWAAFKSIFTNSKTLSDLVHQHTLSSGQVVHQKIEQWLADPENTKKFRYAQPIVAQGYELCATIVTALPDLGKLENAVRKLYQLQEQKNNIQGAKTLEAVQVTELKKIEKTITPALESLKYLLKEWGLLQITSLSELKDVLGLLKRFKQHNKTLFHNLWQEMAVTLHEKLQQSQMEATAEQPLPALAAALLVQLEQYQYRETWDQGDSLIAA